MMRQLKADFHTHAAGDPDDPIAYSEEMLIDAVAAQGVNVLAIACHGANVYCGALARYARSAGVLLIPAQESVIEGKHVVLLNPDAEQAAATTFSELRALGRRDAAFIAPHPFYPIQTALGRLLVRNIDLFDAIEYCTLYGYGVNPNRKAVRVARVHGLPMVGTSDNHSLPYSDSTFTWVETEPTVASVISAIRAGRVRVETRPRPALHTAQMFAFSVQKTLQDVARSFSKQEVSPP